MYISDEMFLLLMDQRKGRGSPPWLFLIKWPRPHQGHCRRLSHAPAGVHFLQVNAAVKLSPTE